MDSLNNACKLESDAWLELQAFKNRQLNRREKLNRNRDLINGIVLSNKQTILTKASASSSGNITSQEQVNKFTVIQGESISHNKPHKSSLVDDTRDECSSQLEHHENPANIKTLSTYSSDHLLPNTYYNSLYQSSNSTCPNLKLVECVLLLKLCDVALKLPIDSRILQRSICKMKGLDGTTQLLVENLLQKFAHQELITIEEPSTALVSRRKQSQICAGSSRLANDDCDNDDESCIYVTSADHTKLVEFDKSFGSSDAIKALLQDSKISDDTDRDEANETSTSRQLNCVPLQDLESLLSLSSTRERESQKLGEELLDLLSKPTAKERNLMERFRSADGYQVQEFCPKGTKGECNRNNNGAGPCDKLHFRKIIAKHTEESLGDCSFLNTCFHMDSCKYVHYEVDYDEKQLDKRSAQRVDLRRHPDQSLKGGDRQPMLSERSTTSDDNNNDRGDNLRHTSDTRQIVTTSSMRKQADLDRLAVEARDRKRFKTVLHPPQWIQCDLRFFDMSLLGKFSVVMADPPWDIHMELPYGTMSDDEMRKLNIPALQDEGVIFLWVTGRAMELGRECLALWGYERCDEVIWVKTNQLQRIIRTGRTGHWLNHGKEHCLVGVKGSPKDINRGLDCDVIVAEVRATSHKPDEIYGIIERLSPGTRKIELFGRPHNVQPNWITLGNQLDGVKLTDPNLIATFKKLNLPYQSDGPI